MPTNQQWVLKRRPEGEIQPGDLELVEGPMPDLADGQVLVRTALSLARSHQPDLDERRGRVPAASRHRRRDARRRDGVVEQSRSDRFRQGDVVNTGLGGWTTLRACSTGRRSAPAPRLPGVPLTAFMSLLGARASRPGSA